MHKREWMILALALIIGMIMVIIVVVATAWSNQYKVVANADKSPEDRVSETTHEPVELDQWYYIERSFREKSNVLDVVDAHSYLEPHVEGLLARRLEGQELKEELNAIIEGYADEQTKKMANDVLMEFVDGYTKEDLNYLLGRVNNSEIKEMLYLIEVQHLISKGIVIE